MLQHELKISKHVERSFIQKSTLCDIIYMKFKKRQTNLAEEMRTHG